MDVPWYAVSLGCNTFEEGESVIREASPKSGSGLKLENILVDTF
jgi:hypothetical protein